MCTVSKQHVFLKTREERKVGGRSRTAGVPEVRERERLGAGLEQPVFLTVRGRRERVGKGLEQPVFLAVREEGRTW